MPLSNASTYKAALRHLSDELIRIQKPILILDAIKWPHQLEHQFFQGKGQSLPQFSREDYLQNNPLSFKPSDTDEQLKRFQSQVENTLGSNDPLGQILWQTAEQYRCVVDLLQQRGRPEFLTASQRLYGSARDRLRGDSLPLIDMSTRLCEIFSLPAAGHLSSPYPKNIAAGEAVTLLSQRLQPYFHDSQFSVKETDGIVSDAAAGGDCIKINRHAHFSQLDLQVLEVHEGWVHIGTTLNGRRQPWASWLSVGSPRITAQQEGLAVLIETLTFSSFPGRARRISDRVVAIDIAEQGGDFLDVYRHFVSQGLSERDSYKIAQRVFRGGMVEGGACFTKDLSYVKGFVETVNFIRSAILSDVPQIIPLLFVGKVALEDVALLYPYLAEGIIEAPHYLPPMFRDLNGLYVWFGLSSGLADINIRSVQGHFQSLFSHLKSTTVLAPSS